MKTVNNFRKTISNKTLSSKQFYKRHNLLLWWVIQGGQAGEIPNNSLTTICIIWLSAIRIPSTVLAVVLRVKYRACKTTIQRSWPIFRSTTSFNFDHLVCTLPGRATVSLSLTKPFVRHESVIVRQDGKPMVFAFRMGELDGLILPRPEAKPRMGSKTQHMILMEYFTATKDQQWLDQKQQYGNISDAQNRKSTDAKS